MLKIYYKTITRTINSSYINYRVFHTGFFTIEDESKAKDHTNEYSLYDDKLINVLYWLNCCDKKRGRVVSVYTSDVRLKFKQWNEPNAKLIDSVKYQECSCSMNELFKLNADKVIAYLKQNGLNITLPS